MTAAPLVRVGTDGGVAVITLDRPQRHNSLVPELLEDLLAAFRSVEGEAVVLAATGRSFSTGGDVTGFWEHRDDLAGYAHRLVGLLNEVIMTMTTLPQPIVVAVHGMVTGGSLGLLLGADEVLIAPEATITPWYEVVGFAPDGGWTAVLPWIIGRRRTAGILADNRTVTAHQACAWGLGSRLGPAPIIADQAIADARLLVGRRRSPRALQAGDATLVAESLESEREAFVSRVSTPEALEGMRRFLGR